MLKVGSLNSAAFILQSFRGNKLLGLLGLDAELSRATQQLKHSLSSQLGCLRKGAPSLSCGQNPQLPVNNHYCSLLPQSRPRYSAPFIAAMGLQAGWMKTCDPRQAWTHIHSDSLPLMLAKFEEYSQALEKELREKVGFRMAISFVLSYVNVVHSVLRKVMEAMNHSLLSIAGGTNANVNLEAHFKLHKQFLGLSRRLDKLRKACEMKAELENLVKAHSDAFGQLPPPPPALTVLTTAQRAPAEPQSLQLPNRNSNNESDDDAEDDGEADTEADNEEETEDDVSSPGDEVGESISSTITFINLETYLITKISSLNQHSLLWYINDQLNIHGSKMKVKGARLSQGGQVELFFDTREEKSAFDLNMAVWLPGEPRLWERDYSVIIGDITRMDLRLNGDGKAKFLKALKRQNKHVGFSARPSDARWYRPGSTGKGKVVVTFADEEDMHKAVNAKSLTWNDQRYAVSYHHRQTNQNSQCSRCQGHGHIQANCKDRQKCTFCGRNHDSLRCWTPVPSKCCNCQGQHPAYHETCPMRGTKQQADNSSSARGQNRGAQYTGGNGMSTLDGQSGPVRHRHNDSPRSADHRFNPLQRNVPSVKRTRRKSMAERTTPWSLHIPTNGGSPLSSPMIPQRREAFDEREYQFTHHQRAALLVPQPVWNQASIERTYDGSVGQGSNRALQHQNDDVRGMSFEGNYQGRRVTTWGYQR